MQVGDLVTLSAYGKKVKRTGWVKEGDIGIVVKDELRVGWTNYKIMWNQSLFSGARKMHYDTRGHEWDWSLHFDRRDLKHVN